MKRHPLDWQGPTFGLLALAIAGWWVARESGVATTTLALLVPISLIVAGLAGLLVPLLGARRDRSTAGDDGPPDPADDGTDHDHIDHIDQTQELR